MPPIDAEGVAAIRGTAFPAPEVSRTRWCGPSTWSPGDPPVPVRVHRPAGVDGAAAGHLHDPRRAATSSARTPWTTSCTTQWGPQLGHGRRLGGVPAGARDALSRARSRTATPPCAGPTSTRTSSAIDPTRIGIYGISAGGGLAAALALLARDRGEFPFAFQLLDCPMLDDRQATPSLAAEGPLRLGRRVERIRLAVLPRRPLRVRRRPALRRRRPGHRPGRPATDLRRGRIDRRLPRRGRGLRRAAEPGRRPVRAARDRGLAARLPDWSRTPRPCGWRRTARTTGWLAQLSRLAAR